MKLYRIGIFFCLICFSLVNAQSPQLSPEDTLYFGKIPEGKIAVRKFSIYNLDSHTLNVSDFRVEGADASHFSILNNPGTFSVGGWQKAYFDIQFQPATEGYFTAHLVIVSNASSSPDRIVVEGYGTTRGGGFIAFERIFGDTKSDGASSVRVTSDGGYILCGSTRNLNRDYSDATLIKTDMYGQVEWREIIGIEDWSESFREAIPTNDGGYIAVGVKAHSDRGYPNDVYVVKTDASGQVEWEDTYGASEIDEANYVIQTSDNGYLISGSYQHNTAQRQDTDAYLIKLKADGSLDWEAQYGGSSGESAGKVVQTGDGGYLFSGSTMSYGAGEWDMYLVKVNATGTEENHWTFGGTDWDNGGGLIAADDGGYLLTGWTANFGAQARDVYIVKIDALYKEVWHKVYGGEHKDSAGEGVQTDDGGYLLVGSTENTYFSVAWRTDGYLLKINGSGDLEWSRVFGGINDEGFGCIRDAGDGGFVISGSANSYGNDSENYFLKVNDQGVVTSVSDRGQVLPVNYVLMQNYPNPFNNQTLIQYHIPRADHVKLEILNLRGQRIDVVFDGYQMAGYHTVTWASSDLASGLYFYRLKTSGFKEIKRMLLIK